MSWEHRGSVAVVGIGFSQLSRRHEAPLGRLTIDACRTAIADAGLQPSDIDGLATYPDQPFRGAGNREGEDLVPVSFVVDHLELAPDIQWYAQVSGGMIPAFIMIGSRIAPATCPWFSSRIRSMLSRSLKWAIRVSSVIASGRPERRPTRRKSSSDCA